jgi:hypothetical protein
MISNLLNNKVTVALCKVKTNFRWFNLHELGDVDSDSSYEGGDDVGKGPAVLALDLAVVVRTTDRQVSLKTHADDQIYAGTDTDPGTKNNIINN